MNLKDLTKPDFPAKFERSLSSFDIESFRHETQVDGPDMELIVSAFKQKTNADDMISFSKPVYSISVQNTEQLKDGMSLTGNDCCLHIYIFVIHNYTYYIHTGEAARNSYVFGIYNYTYYIHPCKVAKNSFMTLLIHNYTSYIHPNEDAKTHLYHCNP